MQTLIAFKQVEDSVFKNQYTLTNFSVLLLPNKFFNLFHTFPKVEKTRSIEPELAGQ